MTNSAIGKSWREFEREAFTPEERAASKLRVALMSELMDARKKNVSMKKLEKCIDIVLDCLEPKGKTLAVVPITKSEEAAVAI